MALYHQIYRSPNTTKQARRFPARSGTLPSNPTNGMPPERPDISFMRAKACVQGKKRSKVEYLASIFNAAGAFLSQHCRVMKCKQTLKPQAKQKAV
jgi:hypothetical protein